jgi:hypothetical protein
MKDIMKLFQNSVKLALVFFLAISLLAQEPKNTKPPSEDKKASPAKDETLAMMKDYTPIATLDPSFSVRNISYLRRAAHNGKGDVLDVQLSVENNEAKTRDYSIYVLAFNESKNPVFNTLAPPPIWRENDPNSKNRIINYSVLCPEKVAIKDVWGEAALKQKEEKVTSNRLKGYTAELGEPNLSEYLFYLTRKPEKALKFKIAGEAIEKSTSSNFESSEAELKRDMNLKAVDTHTYTIFNSKYKTTIMTHHYSEFRPDFYFFNKVAILIFNDKNVLVYKTIQDIGKKREVR